MVASALGRNSPFIALLTRRQNKNRIMSRTKSAFTSPLLILALLVLSLWLALSKYGRIKLGHDDDEPEFSTISWLTMLFAAGMGVGLLFWGTAEPLTHYDLIAQYRDSRESAGSALWQVDLESAHGEMLHAAHPRVFPLDLDWVATD